MDYSFHSTDPDNYNEVRCPVIYTGVCRKVKWYISDISTFHNIVVIGKDDYITLDLGDTQETKVKLDNDYGEANELFYNDLRDKLRVYTGDKELEIEKDHLGRISISSNESFSISDMSYNMAQALGFYYLDTYDIDPVLDADSGKYIFKAKASAFGNYTPVWYLISNLGMPNQINTRNNPWTPIFPALVMSIQNSFQPGQPLTYTNSEYISTSPASALSNLRVKLVDGNLQPIKLTTPLYVGVSLSEIPDEEKQPIEEAMAEQEENKETKQLINDTMTKYHAKKETNQQKVEAGPAVEPQTEIMTHLIPSMNPTDSQP